jgi:hypothetical protein
MLDWIDDSIPGYRAWLQRDGTHQDFVMFAAARRLGGQALITL